MAVFGHPIIAGNFGSLMFPMLVGWFLPSTGSTRRVAAFGCIGCVGMILACASSGPILAFMGGLIGLVVWNFRGHMRQIRVGLVMAYIGLDMVMKAPAYALIGRLSLVGGSTAYHRFALLDAFIHHFSEWWLAGTQSTADWGYFTFDVANQYVGTGVTSGAVGLALFLVFLGLAFASVGVGLRQNASRGDQLLIWGVGSSLLGCCLSFMGVAYFDQVKYLWLLLPAACAAMATPRAINQATSADSALYGDSRAAGQPDIIQA